MFNLTLCARKSILQDVKCYEEPNIEMLDKLLKSDLLKDDFNNPICKHNFTDEKEQLSKYKLLFDSLKRAVVVYKRTKGMSFGRVFPAMSLSLFSIRREIRQTLSKGIYEDIDVENCHPQILYQILQQNSLKCKYLGKYVSKREEYLQEVMDVYGVSREDAKKLFIRILYLGSFTKWLNENGKIDNGEHISKFIRRLKTELNDVAEMLVNKNKKLVYEIEQNKEKNGDTDYNLKSSVLSYFLQEYECIILECMYNFLVNRSIIVNNDCVLCADGIMIKKHRYNDNLLKQLSEIITKETGFILNITNKEMTQDYIDIVNDHINTPTLDINGYEFKKQQFEETHFKSLNPVSFCSKLDSGLIVRSKRDFTICYENIKVRTFKKVKDDYVPQITKFCNLWFDDENIRTYDRIDFYPKCQPPPNVYNLYDGFKAETLPKHDLNIKDTLMWKHIQYLCNNDPLIIDYLIKWVAHIIQKPYKRIGTCLLIRSIQGTGKDTFFNFIGTRLLGSKYYFNDANFELIFGKFNSMIENKILIVGNEVSATDTSGFFGKVINTITSPKLSIERKGISAYECNNFSSFVFLTNNDFPFKISHSDRRFVCWEASPLIANNTEYFNNLYNEIESGKLDRLFYDYFNSIDIDDFSPSGNRPMTSVYNEMRQYSIPPYIRFLDEYTSDNADVNREIKSDDFYSEFITYLKNGGYKYDMSITKFILKIKEFTSVQSIRTSKCRRLILNNAKLRAELIMKRLIDDEKIEFIDNDDKSLDMQD